MDKRRHEILLRALPGIDGTADLEVRCSCGVFLMDRKGDPAKEEEGAQASLIEITGLVAAHYMITQHPEKNNGSTKLIRGKK